MATVPNPRTWVSEQVTDAKLNTDVRDGFNFFKSPPLCRLKKNANQSIPENTATALTWQTEVIDRDIGHNTVTNISRYTSQTSGLYFARATVMLSYGGNKATWADLYLRKNGTTIYGRSVLTRFISSQYWDSPIYTSAFVPLSQLDYLEVVIHILQSGGAADVVALSLSELPTCFDIKWVSP